LSDQPVLEFRGVSKGFAAPGGGARLVVDSLSFALRPGQFTAIVGPSGCGKTTLLHLAAGLAMPSRGEVRHGGARVADVNTRIGYITQQANLFPWFTLRQNVEFPLLLRGVAPAERRERSARFLALAGLSGFEDHYPHQLSGGMQKRGAIIRTLVYAPDVVLMDEPFGALDAQTRMVMQNELLTLWQQQGTTILFVTHDLVEAVALADNVILLGKQPTRIKADFAIGVPRPRDVFEPFRMPGFVETYERIWATFRSEVAQAAAVAG
jgi:ABC-type nitrate/sulfonate/bicarbonate transport system ATPase subunit